METVLPELIRLSFQQGTEEIGRHLQYFKSVAYESQLNIVSSTISKLERRRRHKVQFESFGDFY